LQEALEECKKTNNKYLEVVGKDAVESDISWIIGGVQ
jgi:hypothetical protein